MHPERFKHIQSRASDIVDAEAVRRHRAFCEDLAAIGGHIAYASHDDLHVFVPEGKVEEGGAIVERYLRNYCAQVIIDAIVPYKGVMVAAIGELPWPE